MCGHACMQLWILSTGAEYVMQVSVFQQFANGVKCYITNAAVGARRLA